MKAYETLTTQGKMRRYHRMAHIALQAYPLNVNKIQCLTIRHNIIFRVNADEGNFVLRIGYPNVRTALMVESEMRWLDAMREIVDLKLAYPIRTKDNQWMVTCEIEGIPQTHQVVVMSWLKGTTVETAPTATKLSAMGTALARLHNFAESYRPTSPFMTYDNFHCDEWGRLDYLSEQHSLLSSEKKKLFKTAISLSEDALIAWRNHDGLSLIHADFHLKNVNWYRGELGVFDFDDCRWGHFSQDWGVILSWLDTMSLREAFISGYESERTIPFSDRDFQLALLHRLMVGLTFTVNYRPNNIPSAVNNTFGQVNEILHQI